MRSLVFCGAAVCLWACSETPNDSPGSFAAAGGATQAGGSGGVGGASGAGGMVPVPIVPMEPGDVTRALAFGSTGAEEVRALSVDAQDRVLLVGSFEMNTDLGLGPVAGAGEQSGFVLALSPEGAPAWAKGLAASERTELFDVESDALGNVYVCGSFSGGLTFAGQELVSEGAEDLLVAKYDSLGTELWAAQFGGAGLERGYSLGLNATGGVSVLTRAVGGVVDFGDAGALIVAEDEVTSLLLVGISAEGEALDVLTLSDTAVARGTSLTIDPTGNVVVAGSFSGEVDLGAGPQSGDFAAFAASYGADGSYQWSQTATQGVGARTVVNATSQNALGRVLLTGSVHAGATFGGIGLTPAGEGDVLVAALDPGGVPAWAVSFGAGENETGRSVVADATGGGVVVGSYRGQPTFALEPLVLAQTTNTFILKVDALGTPLFSRGFATSSSASGMAVGLRADGTVVSAGAFEGQVDFDGTVVTSQGLSDVYLVELLP